jgi:serine/threonine protein kinase
MLLDAFFIIIFLSFYGMEFCVASLDHLFLPKEDPKRYKGPMPSHEQFFFQLVTGLQYIHRKNLVHGSIKPSNILIYWIYSENDPQIKLSEFGLTFPRWNDKTDTGFQSDQYWIAPELHNSFEKAQRKQLTNFQTMFKPTVGSDSYALGKVFFYYYCKTYAMHQNTFEGSHEYVFSKC